MNAADGAGSGAHPLAHALVGTGIGAVGGWLVGMAAPRSLASAGTGDPATGALAWTLVLALPAWFALAHTDPDYRAYEREFRIVAAAAWGASVGLVGAVLALVFTDLGRVLGIRGVGAAGVLAGLVLAVPFYRALERSGK